MTHYVCTGDCKHTADAPGVCQSDFCNKNGEELKVCGCEDGSHESDGSMPESSQAEETTE